MEICFLTKDGAQLPNQQRVAIWMDFALCSVVSVAVVWQAHRVGRKSDDVLQGTRRWLGAAKVSTHTNLIYE